MESFFMPSLASLSMAAEVSGASDDVLIALDVAEVDIMASSFLSASELELQPASAKAGSNNTVR